MEEKDWALHREYLHYDDASYVVGEHVKHQIFVDTRVAADVANEVLTNIENHGRHSVIS